MPGAGQIIGACQACALQTSRPAKELARQAELGGKVIDPSQASAGGIGAPSNASSRSAGTGMTGKHLLGFAHKVEAAGDHDQVLSADRPSRQTHRFLQGLSLL